MDRNPYRAAPPSPPTEQYVAVPEDEPCDAAEPYGREWPEPDGRESDWPAVTFFTAVALAFFALVGWLAWLGR